MRKEEIESLIEKGDEYCANARYELALECYRKAIKLVPGPFIDQEISTEILTAMGDVFFKTKDYDEADKIFSDVMLCPGAAANAYIRLRRGQIAFEMGNVIKAKTELACAYMNGGPGIFDDEDKKYVDFIKPIIEDALRKK